MHRLGWLVASFVAALIVAATSGRPAWAQTGAGKIVFESWQATGTSSGSRSQIGVMNADGSSQTNISNNKFNDWNPSFNHSGSKILFLSDRTGTQEIYVMNADGASTVRLTNNASNKFPLAIADPSFSPDGTKIVFSGIPLNVPNSTWDIYLMNANGSSLTRLTTSPPGSGGVLEAVFTPDGKKIAFLGNSTISTSAFSLYEMNLDGSGVTLLSAEGGNNLPAFSPDGSKIAITNNSNIVLLNADGTGQTILVSGGTNGSPTFSPDGTRIAFASVVGSAEEVFTINLDGTGLAQLTFGPGISPPSSIESNAPGTWVPGTVGAPVLTSIALNPASVLPGSPSQGTVSLSGVAPAGGAVITLTSSSSSASVPASVTIPAGSTSATFPVSTTSVPALTVATLTATFDGVSQSATLTIDPSQPTTTVAITRAEYTVSQNQLQVEATSTSATDTLTLYVTSTGARIGTMTNAGGGKYEIKTTWPVNPVNVTVKSSLGGSASLNVMLK